LCTVVISSSGTGRLGLLLQGSIFDSKLWNELLHKPRNARTVNKTDSTTPSVSLTRSIESTKTIELFSRSDETISSSTLSPAKSRKAFINNSSLITAGAILGSSSRYKATAPVTNGAATDVPDSGTVSVSFAPIQALQIRSPGAAMSTHFPQLLERRRVLKNVRTKETY